MLVLLYAKYLNEKEQLFIPFTHILLYLKIINIFEEKRLASVKILNRQGVSLSMLYANIAVKAQECLYRP